MAANPISALSRTARGVASFGLLLTGVQVVQAGDASRTDRMSVETLKSVYLECERSASGNRLGTGDAMHCSIVYEELERQAFDGDFGRIRSWLARQSTPVG